MNTSLYEIDTRWIELLSKLEETSGELTPELEVEYDDLLTLSADKAASYIAICRTLDHLAKGAEEQAAYFSKKQKAAEGRVKWLKDRLLNHMVLTGDTKIETPIGKLSISQTAAPVVVEVEPADLPARFQRWKFEADKTAIKEALQAGEPDLKGLAHFGEPTKYVRIT